ncbi:MAG: zinc ABC transporter substrate-binding protein [Planctomycetota bacterium]|nr:zinc ABC transporter substrate-binding protein [Planctomycetota bacterium]
MRFGRPGGGAGVVALALAGAVGSLMALTGCSDRTPTQAGAQAPSVVATIGMVGDVAREIAGPDAQVTTLMGEGVDPHLYKASPGDVRTMSDAALILYNGLHLEGRMADVIVKMAGQRRVVQVTDAIEPAMLREPPEFAGHYDPHVWFDVSLWAKASDRIASALEETVRERAPDRAPAVRARAQEYRALLAELHDYALNTLATIPQSSRVLITAHDAFGYFGRAYALDVRGIQGISTDSEASLQDINALVTTLVELKVPAVFIESSVPRKTVDALIEGARARGHEVKIGGELFSDALGAAGTLEGTYVGMVLHNVETVTRALGGTVPAERPARLAAYVARFTQTPSAAPAGSKAP